MKIESGLHESLVTRGLDEALRKATDLSSSRDALSEASAAHVLGRYNFDALVKTLRSIPEENRAAKQVKLTNNLIQLFEKAVPESGIDDDDLVVDPAELLMAVRMLSDAKLGANELRRPIVPLRQSDLLVNGPNDISLAPAIRGELASADAVDMIVSFVKFNGVRMIEPDLRAFARRSPTRLRVLTTTYMGATEPDAIEALLQLGADVRVSYDARSTRLHAKAWLFHRNSSFSTALIGSSNLSPAAMLDGCEWNVRLSSVDNRTILEKFIATFLQYWSDTDSFEPYDRARFIEETRRRDPQRDALANAVQLRPYPHQKAALDALEQERARGHHRNLVIAATGTGKTVVAALDYARLRKEWKRDPSLLFVAHTEEILSQSLAKYRAAVRDGHFGELKVGTRQPREGHHVFASIQSLHGRALESLSPTAYEIVVVDEFHHAAASSYERLLSHLKPKSLLGLTATPERTDGRSIMKWFDGRIATELRLWDALDKALVSPFQYFGVHDNTDLSMIDFVGGRYDIASLERVYSADDVRAQAVLRAVEQYVRDPHSMRAIGFCVSIKHAQFMAQFFAQRGLPATAVDATTSDAERHRALEQLRAGEIRVLFAVNLFNEGMDVPSIDTVLFLRPTESGVRPPDRGRRRLTGLGGAVSAGVGRGPTQLA